MARMSMAVWNRYVMNRRIMLLGMGLILSGCTHESVDTSRFVSAPIPGERFLEANADLKPLEGEVTPQGWPRRIQHKASGMTLLFVPSGSFMMGSPETEAKRDQDEVYWRATIDRPFYLGETEVTVGQYARVMGRRAVDPDSPYMGNDDLPMTGLSWVDAKAFVDRLNKRWGSKWRMPTEVQWEYACRAGTSTPFSFGENTTPEFANYAHRYPYLGRVGPRTDKRPVPVKSYPANPWGFYDMHGNVWEWSIDLYQFDPRKLKAFDGDAEGQPRVIRGGSYTSSGTLLRCAYRDGYPPLASLGPKYGLRVALALEGPAGSRKI